MFVAYVKCVGIFYSFCFYSSSLDKGIIFVIIIIIVIVIVIIIIIIIMENTQQTVADV